MRVNVRPAVAPTLTRLLVPSASAPKCSGPGEWIAGARLRSDQARCAAASAARRAAIAPRPTTRCWSRTCGHISIASSKALALAGIDETLARAAGRPDRAADGRLTGLLAENARLPLTKACRRWSERRPRRRHRAWRQVPAVLRHNQLHGRRRRPSRRLRRDRRLPEGEAHRPPAGPHLADPARRSRRRHRRQGHAAGHGLRHRRRHADDRCGQDLPRRLSRRPHRLDVEALPRRRRDHAACHARATTSSPTSCWTITPRAISSPATPSATRRSGS